MATSASLHKFGTGGGGLIGDGHRLLLRRCIFKEHSFESKDRDTGVVTKTYEPGCMLEVDMQVLDPIDPSDPKQSFVMQYYNVGNLPSKRVQQLGWQVDPKRPGGLGGYSPSTDNENPAVEGPFVVMDGKTDIWEQADFSLFQASLLNLGLNEHLDRLDAQGMSCLDGTIIVGRAQVKEKGKNAKPDAKERQVLVAESVERWGWEVGDAPAAAAPAQPAVAQKPKAAAKPRAAAAPAPASAPAPAPAAAPAPSTPLAAGGILTFASASEEIQGRTMELLGELIAAKGTIVKKDVGKELFRITGKEGPARTGILQVANDPETAEAGAAMGLWGWDASSETFSAAT